MCGGKPKVDTKYQDFQMSEAKRARREEEERQARIKAGLERIAAVFEGGSYNPIDYDAMEAAEEANAQQWEERTKMAQNIRNNGTPLTGGINGGAPGYIGADRGGEFDPYARRINRPRGGGDNDHEGANAMWPLGQRALNEKMANAAMKGATNPADYIQKLIFNTGETVTHEGMNPILDQRRAAMEGYYLPQLDQQYQDAKDQLTFALARAGLVNSTAAGEKQADLSRKMGLASGDIMSRIASDIASTRSRMNQQRATIESGLRASGDASAAANQALQAAVTFRQDQPTLSPLGDLFYGIADTVGTAKNAQAVADIRKKATPPPLTSGSSGRVVWGS